METCSFFSNHVRHECEQHSCGILKVLAAREATVLECTVIHGSMVLVFYSGLAVLGKNVSRVILLSLGSAALNNAK